MAEQRLAELVAEVAGSAPLEWRSCAGGYTRASDWAFSLVSAGPPSIDPASALDEAQLADLRHPVGVRGPRHRAAGLAASVRSPAMHLRPPSFDHGTVSGMWAVGLGLYVLLGLLAIGIALGTAVVVAVVAIGLIFLYVRLYGEDEVRRPPRS